MQKLYSTFPGGRQGLGLLILRTAAGIATGAYGGIVLSRLEAVTNSQISYISQLILSLLLITGSVFFLLGLMMPFVSVTVAACELAAAFIRLVQATPPPGKQIRLDRAIAARKRRHRARLFGSGSIFD